MSFYRIGAVALLLSCCFLALGCHAPSTKVPTPDPIPEVPVSKVGTPEPEPTAHLSEVPEDLDLSTQRRSRDGRFLGRLSSDQQPPPLDTLHTWVLELEDSTGKPVSGARVRVDGGMPQHSHGLPTQPLARPGDQPGTYLIEGLRFHMRGWWQLILVIEDPVAEEPAAEEPAAEDPVGSDVLTFDFVLK